MALMTPQEYIESLRKLNTRVYMFGEKIDNWVDHPMIRPSINCVAMTYALAQDPQYAELMTVKSSLTGHTINRFTHLHQSTEDLMNKVKMQRLLGQKTASCFQRCVGMDAFNAVFSTTYEIDEKYGTHYHENFKKFLTFVQDNDLTVDGAMTDPKGDRSKAPSQQADPDMYVHVVEKRPDGIVVCGAKCHQTGSINSHWHIFMPTISMGEADKDWAVSFACPTDAEGMYMIYGRQSCDTRKLEEDARASQRIERSSASRCSSNSARWTASPPRCSLSPAAGCGWTSRPLTSRSTRPTATTPASGRSRKRPVWRSRRSGLGRAAALSCRCAGRDTTP